MKDFPRLLITAVLALAISTGALANRAMAAPASDPANNEENLKKIYLTVYDAYVAAQMTLYSMGNDRSAVDSAINNFSSHSAKICDAYMEAFLKSGLSWEKQIPCRGEANFLLDKLWEYRKQNAF